ncbi:hypothetical protein AALP_AA6G193900 [Arabis alpina]|uniref:Uncharacterized protein n=1 Tax=Arabis alpina TaxID=50452 RepID=A0A087GQA2_ARAAL|nr:hypothetical protein AALP_AA6G193900 [Arabis alpina]
MNGRELKKLFDYSSRTFDVFSLVFLKDSKPGMIQVLTNQVDYGPQASKGSQHMTNHSGIWKCLRKTTSNGQGCFIPKCYFANISMRNCLIFFVSRLFPFDVMWNTKKRCINPEELSLILKELYAMDGLQQL